MRRAAGFDSYYSGQAQNLAEWVESRKRERRLNLVPQTKTQEELEIARLNRLMALVGVPAGIGLIIGILLLLIYHYGWWTIVAFLSAAVVGYCVRKLGWWV